MDTFLEAQDELFNTVFDHLNSVQQDPHTTLLDADLLKRAQRSLDFHTPRQLLWQVLQTGQALLEIVQQDPTPLTTILVRTVQLIPFDELKSTISTSKIEEGLRSPSRSIQLLCIAYLTKAADLPSGAAFVAASSSLVQLLVTAWLSVKDTGVSSHALECIVALLVVDSPSNLTVVPSDPTSTLTLTPDESIAPAPAPTTIAAHGQGLLWRRIFHDPDVYSLLFLWTSLVKSNHDLTTREGQHAVTISQGRLLDFVIRVAQLNWAEITSTKLPKVEAPFLKQQDADQKAQSQQPYEGLLKYVVCNMIDPEDLMMTFIRRDFFVNLLKAMEEQSEGGLKAPVSVIQAIQQEAGIDTLSSDTDGLHL